MAALFFAHARWDGNIGRESAALIESSLLSAVLVPGRALHPMGGDAHDRFHRAREAPDRYGLAPHGPCRPFQGTQAGLEAQKERPPSLRRWPNFIKQRLCPALYNLGCRRHHFTLLTRNSSIFQKSNPVRAWAP